MIFLCFLGFSGEHKGGWLCALWEFPIEEALLQPGPFLEGWESGICTLWSGCCICWGSVVAQIMGIANGVGRVDIKSGCESTAGYV